jgi:hypothetical protein
MPAGEEAPMNADLAPLPEGHTGLAARYPGDAGLERDPAVVFADRFEDIEDAVMEASAVHQKGNRWDGVWGLMRITRNPEHVHTGRQAAEITHAEPRSHGAEKRLEPGFDTLFLRYYMKYHEQFPGCHHTGMLIVGLAPDLRLADHVGVRPTGRDHFSARVDTMPPWSGEGASPGPPGYMDIYSYHMDQQRKWGDILYPTGDTYPPREAGFFGDGFVPRPNLMAERGRWYCYEVMVKANTPGQRDGRIAFWVDGKLAGDFPNLRLRSAAELKANWVVIDSYSSSRHPNTTHWYDDVVAATSYIGPQVATGTG